VSNDKYPSIFRSIEAIVFVILQIFFATRAVLKTGEYNPDISQLKLELLSHVTHLDQSRVSENI